MATKLRMGAKGRSSFAAARMMGDERCADGVREKANASAVAEEANTKKTTGGEQRMVEEESEVVVGRRRFSCCVLCERGVRCQGVQIFVWSSSAAKRRDSVKSTRHHFLPSPY